MKKLILYIFILSITQLVHATVYLDETFNYTVGDINAQGSWITAGSYTGGTGYTIGSSSLSYNVSTLSYVLSGSGKAFVNNIGTTATDYKAYKPFNGGASVSSGVIYLSFLMKANANISSTNQELFGLADGTSAGPKVLIGKTTTGFFKIGTVRGSTASADYKYAASPTSLTVGTTYFIVLKYDFSTSTSSVYINPTLDGSEPASPEISDATSATTRTKLSNLWVRATGTIATISTVSGARVSSSSWAEAVASTAYVPPVSSALTAPVVGTASSLASSGFTANWTPSANATGYTVKVYWGTTFVDSTNASGQSASSVAVTKLVPGLTYTYNVIARGNGSTNADSNPSTSSASFTLLTATIPSNTLKIILKLDDLGVLNSVFAASPVYDYLTSNKVKFGGGAIANRFDATSLGVLSPYLSATNAVGDTLIEVWNHGYTHTYDAGIGIYEFSGETYANQKSHFDMATSAVKTYLGVQMHSFGTPYNASDATTNMVISEDPNYKAFLFSDIIPATSNGVTYLDHRVNMESATGNPLYNYFVANYNTYKNSYTDYMVLQGHPNYYTSGSSNLEQFKLIVQFLMSEGVEFVRPYDYQRSLTFIAPSGLAATAISESEINLSWTDNSSTETKFRIERSTDASTWTLIGTSAQNTTSYSDTNVPSAGKYYYRIYATCGMSSAYSNQVLVDNTQAGVLLEANGPGNTYELINSVFAPGYTAVETADTFDPTFGRHIAEVWDTDLAKYVFEFYAHSSVTNELQDISTGDTDRQRVEIKTYAASPDSLKGVSGETIKYKWKFKIPTGFQPSPNFTHIHQIKAVDGLESSPIFTLTPRYNASGNQLELIFVDGYGNSTKETTADLSQFENTWVEATELIRVDSVHGSYSIIIKKVSDGSTMLSYSNSDMQTIRYNNSFIRPKWGIYRSIVNIDYLRDETMRFNSFSIQEIKNQAQTITFPALPSVTYGDDNFSPNATTSAGVTLPVTYTSSNTAVATIVNDSIHIIGAGTSTITAKQVGNASYAAATNVTQTLTVGKSDQTIAFSAVTKAFGDADFSPATASSGLTPTYASSNTAVATIVNGKVHVVGAGTSTITASQGGNTNYNAATDVSQTLTVTTSALYTYSPTSVTVTSGSTNSGTYANLASNDASYLRINSTTSGTRTLDWYGSVTISQSVSSVGKLIVNYDGRSQFSKTQILYLYNFTTSSWTQIDSRTVSTSDVSITSEQTSPANYISSGGVIRLRVYTSGGTQNYSCAADFMQFTIQNINKSDQTISFASLPSKTFGDVDFAPGATASSGLSVTYASSNTAVATIVSNQIHIVGAGTTIITASQPGDSYTNAATDVSQSLTVSKLNQTITFGALSSKYTYDADFTPGATSNSSMPISYSSSNPLVATIVSNQIHIVGSGTTTITASQAGDSNTNAATDVAQNLTVIGVLLDETFNYSVTNLANEATWTTAGTLTTGTGRNILLPALTYSDGSNSYILSGVGKTMNADITSTTDYKSYKSFGNTVSSGSIYLTFMYKAGVSQSQTASEVFGLATGTSAGAKVWAGKGTISTSNYRFGTTRGSTTSGDVKWSTTEYSDANAVILIVLKYDFATSTSSIFLNPTLGSSNEPTADISDNTSATIRTSLNNLWLRNTGSSNAKYNVGGARVSTTWGDAVAKNIATKLAIQTSSTLVTSYRKTIFASEVGSIRVYNLQGTQLLQAEGVNSVETNLATGFYIVQFTNSVGGKVVQKIAIR
ncbi:MAG: hypothetical protein ACOYOT_06990 [Bacteroidales bacterium]